MADFRTAAPLLAALALPAAAAAQVPGGRVPGGCEAPAAADSGAVAGVGAPAARAVVAAFGRTWLLALAGERWRPAAAGPAAGRRAAVVGPLPVGGAARYEARYMEAVFPPGMQTAVHTHAGPEAWFLVTGAQCLQTPDTTLVVPAGGSAVVPAGPPMRLTGVGAGTRRALVLVLHDAARPWMTLDRSWAPGGPC